MKKMFLVLMVSGLFVACNQNNADTPTTETQTTTPAVQDNPPSGDVWLGSLITATPQEGRELAMKMARKTIGTIQSDGEVKKRLRGEYAENAELLILSAQVVAIEFQTVAEANNYWRK